LYCSLGRSILEFASIIWYSKHNNLIDKLEKIQRRFLRMMAYKLGRVDVSVDIIAMEFGLESLASRRLYNDIAFVHKLINGKLFCPESLRKINFKIPAFNSMNSRPFLVLQCSTNIIYKHSPEYRLLDACNNVINFDFSFDSHLKLKNIIINLNRQYF